MTTKHRAANGYNVAIVAIVALGSFTYGFNNSIIGSVFGMPGFFEVSQSEHKAPNPFQSIGPVSLQSGC